MPKTISQTPFNTKAAKMSKNISKNREQLLAMAMPIIASTVHKCYKANIHDPALSPEDLIQDISLVIYHLLPKFKPTKCTYSSWITLRARHDVIKQGCRGPMGLCPDGWRWFPKSKKPRQGREYTLNAAMTNPIYLDDDDCTLKHTL